MKSTKTAGDNKMDKIRRACLVALISALTTALFAAAMAGTAHADSLSSEKALARLVKDIELLRPALAPSSEAAGATVTADGYYMIRRGDSLDRIIARVLPQTPVRKNILRQAIISANPHAFKRKNPNWMYAGKRIKLPDSDDIHKVIFTQPSNKLDKAKAARDERKNWVHFP